MKNGTKDLKQSRCFGISGMLLENYNTVIHLCSSHQRVGLHCFNSFNYPTKIFKRLIAQKNSINNKERCKHRTYPGEISGMFFYCVTSFQLFLKNI